MANKNGFQANLRIFLMYQVINEVINDSHQKRVHILQLPHKEEQGTNFIK